MRHRVMSPFTFRAVLFSICLLISAVALAAPPKYKLARLGRLGHQYSEGHSINNSGDVMGSLYDGAFQRAFLYKNGQMTDISPFRGQVFCNAMNNKGDIVGNTADGPFVYANGQFNYLPTEQYDLITANDINDSGQVTGLANTRPASGNAIPYLYDSGTINLLPTGPFSQLFIGNLNRRGEVAGGAVGGGVGTFYEHAYLYSNGSTTDLGVIPGGGESFALAINGSAEITGRALNANGLHRAFLYSNGIMTDLGTLGGDESFGLDINSRGHVLGTSYVANGDLRAFIYRNGSMIDLGALGGIYSDAHTITDNGIVAGIVGKSVGSTTVFIYGVDGNITHDLNDLISPTDPSRPFVTLYDVGLFRPANGLGQVLALGLDSRTGRTHSYVASPIDSTKPVVEAIFSGTMGTNGWYTSNVGINWSVTDAEAPIANTTGCKSSTVYSDTAGLKFTCSAKSIGGLATKVVTVKRDTTLPTVSIVKPANGAVFSRNQVITASYTCSDSPAGIASCIGPVGNGDPIDTSKQVTNKSFTVRTTDKAGFSRMVTKTYSVQ